MNISNTLKYATARGLIYLGYFLGVILVLEGIAKYIREGDQQVIWVFLISIGVWGLGYFKRRKISKQVIIPRFATKEAYLRIEFMYFLISYTFVALFTATFLRYLPVQSTTHVTALEGVDEYSELLIYFTKVLPFNLIIKIT